MSHTDTIITIRKLLKITQRELGRQLGVTGGYIDYLEQGKRTPSQKLLFKIIDLCGIHNISYEVTYEEKRNVKSLKILLLD